ncbi:hypothetical protein EYF80_048937 [Liparis tanakae]|uniref:Uncharacterized protein n=1 Tax=Liparis tanakae TaxID=230148 RepID=A0A4Z2FJE1_9TELE|nr:hypothetical protein EYF80_048937 [Liparis tanakae]
MMGIFYAHANVGVQYALYGADPGVQIGLLFDGLISPFHFFCVFPFPYVSGNVKENAVEIYLKDFYGVLFRDDFASLAIFFAFCCGMDWECPCGQNYVLF